MAASQWQRVEELFHATMQLDAPDRADHLSRECGADEVLRREVESLVAASQDEHSFLDRPALSLGMKLLSRSAAGSLLGQSIGHYKILKLLGAGGMGEVYLAEDSTLGRQVALKFLARSLVDDSWAKAQLMREARAVAQLENPNICAIYGLEEIDEHNFIVMQYLEGETLHSLLKAGPLALDCALDFSEQIANALATAHRRRIIHRDVKPQNMVVAPDGKIRVLDFGLAKFVQQALNVETPSTQTDQTQLGIVVGTVAYMSPEQTEGAELDSCSDIFSLGVVMYEMLTGQNPFLRATKEETIAAIQSDEPAPLKNLPQGLSGVVSRCLQKTRNERFTTAEELLAAIRHLKLELVEKENQAPTWRPKYLKQYAVAATILVAILLVVGSFVYMKASRVHTLALIPIRDRSSDPNMVYMSEGLTRVLFEKFSYLPRLKVKLPTINQVKPGQELDPVQAGRALNVDAVLTGELVKQGVFSQLHLTMTNTADGRVLWDETITIDAVNMLTLQDRATLGVSSNLGMWLFDSEKKFLTKRQTGDEEALRLYMNGRYFWSLKRDRENIKKAIEFFEKALARDPAFARAYTGLADCYAIMSTVGYGALETKEAMNKAHWAARQALEIEQSPEAHTSMGVLRLRFDWEWNEAERDFQRAIAMNPDYSQSHYWYANLLAIMGRSDEAIRQSQIAKELDPYSPLAEMNYGRALYYARRFNEAESYFRQLLARDPEYPQFLNILGLVQLQQGNIPAAISTLEKLQSKDPLMAAAPLGYAYGKAGRQDAARRLLRELDEISKSRPVPAQEKAIIHLGLGEIDEAFELLEKSLADRFPALAYLTTDPLYDGLRSDRRFAPLAGRIGLEIR